MGPALTPLVKPDLYELFTLHAAARGTPVPRGAAKTVFAPDGTVTPFAIGVILAAYLLSAEHRTQSGERMGPRI